MLEESYRQNRLRQAAAEEEAYPIAPSDTQDGARQRETVIGHHLLH